MKKLTLSLVISITFSYLLSAQEYNYVHYDAKDGLAGSTVYDIAQDKDGFLWFATESGVSRFDGTHFKNFTTADGLPETEILKVFADSHGRVWIVPFKNEICYYFEGRLHTKENDSILKQIRLSGCIANIFEDRLRNIAMRSNDFHSYVITNNGIPKVYTLDSIRPGVSIDAVLESEKGFLLHSNSQEHNGFVVDSFFSLIDKKVKFIGHITRTHTTLARLLNDSSVQVVTPVRNIREIDFFRPNTYFWNTTNGSWLTDKVDRNAVKEIFLKGKQTSHSFIDNENNYWFGTLGKGLYKLASREFKTYSFNNLSEEIFSIASHNDTILAGGIFGRLYKISGKHVITRNYNIYLSHSDNFNSSNRITSIKKLASGKYILGLDGFVCSEGSPEKLINYNVPSVKSIDEIDTNRVLVSTSRSVVILSSKDLRILDTIWRSRATDICYYNNSYYVGSTEGLYILDKDKSVHFAGENFKPFRYRIGCLARSADSNIWVATYGAGIVGMKKNKVIAHLTTVNGLTSDACRTLFVRDHFLWVGTDKGLNKIDISNTSYPVVRYTMGDGLPSNIINAIFSDSTKIYIATPAGLTFFDESKISRSSSCRLKILNITVSDEHQPVKTDYSFANKDNNFRIEFVAISFKSGGDILYRYRLKGLKDTWDSTRQNVLAYPSLPSGNYELQLVAINKFGVVSNSVNIVFSIATPFWQTIWFFLLMIAAIISLTSFIIIRRFQVLRKREQERIAVQQKVNDLEQLALRAQMNPHFIFNCLNSIQHFIIRNDLETTNEYLTGFADLIRQTLNNSEKGIISLHNEARYLERYLQLEKMRFGNSFSYTIEIDTNVDQDATYIPSMILQPYVENSIRHGMRHRKDKNGFIRIKFHNTGTGLSCTIEDNGIGRKKALEYKSASMHVEYQSKGMTLTAERIHTLNRQYMELISIEIIDLTENDGESSGTRIVIHFPDTILTKFNIHDQDRYYRR